MRLAIRGKLFLGSVFVLMAAGSFSAIYLERDLRLSSEARLESELSRYAALARLQIESLPKSSFVEGLDPIADRLGRAAASRVTIIDAEGRVIGDSEVPQSELASLQDHRDRPEVQAASKGAVGIARRNSSTLQTEMLYLAVPFEHEGGRGTVRLATPLAEVDQAARALRLKIAIAGLMGLLVAVVMSALASQLFSRTLRDLLEKARGIAGRRPTSDSDAAIADEIGHIEGSLFGLAQDLERTVQTLAHERDRFGALLEGLSEAVLALDDQGRLSLVNRAAIQLLGISGDPIGRTLLEVTRSPELAEVVRAARAGTTSTLELDLAGAPARRILARATNQKLGGGCVLILVNVSDQRRLETIRRDFVANVSHELRTPVSVIQASAETLLEAGTEDPGPAKKFIEALVRNSRRLSRLISDLLDLSRIEAGQYPLELQGLDLKVVVERSTEAVEAAAKEKRLTLEIDLPDALKASADPRGLEQVLVNLLDNAVKYTQQEGRIRVRGHSIAGGVKIQVEDDGPGIELRHRARIFERFYRADPGRSREMGGTGLGLAIVRHLVEAMGGQVGLEPAQPRGSIFWFTLRAEDGAISHLAPISPKVYEPPAEGSSAIDRTTL